MKTTKIMIGFLAIVVIAEFAYCFNRDVINKPSKGHECNYTLCPMKTEKQFEGCGYCEQNSDCWKLDSIHFEHPYFTYDQCDSTLMQFESRPFVNGEILLPDYCHSDTLKVINASALNYIFDGVDLPSPATDSEIDSTLHLYCIKN